MYKIKHVSGRDEFVASLDKLERAEMTFESPNSTYTPYSYGQLAYDDSGIWVHMHSDEARDNLRAEITEPNGDTYTDSCMELFFVATPQGGNTSYFNFEVNVIGTVHVGYGPVRESRKLLANADSKAFFRVESASSLDQITGDFWDTIYYIPFSFIAEHAPGFVPGPGTVMTGNFYKIGDMTPRRHYLMWRNIDMPRPNFHQPGFFGEWVFE